MRIEGLRGRAERDEGLLRSQPRPRGAEVTRRDQLVPHMKRAADCGVEKGSEAEVEAGAPVRIAEGHEGIALVASRAVETGLGSAPVGARTEDFGGRAGGAAHAEAIGRAALQARIVAEGRDAAVEPREGHVLLRVIIVSQGLRQGAVSMASIGPLPTL